MGSIISSLQFLSFKIDKMSLDVANTTRVLLKSYSSKDDWSFSVGIRHPSCIVEERMYIGGVDIKMFAGNKDNPDVQLHAGIAGVFKVVGNDIPPDKEERGAKNQIPALLSPYLRAAITATLASAGFGAVVLPLINFNALAEEQLKDVAIERIDHEETPTDLEEEIE